MCAELDGADCLASTSAVSLHRELQELVDEKFIDGPADEMDWPTLSDSRPSLDPSEAIESEIPYRQYWSSLHMPLASPTHIDLSPLPPTWAVVSISVSDDFSSMFVTRHQRDVSPIIFCLPFDRQGKRELGDDVDGLPFELARAEMKEIIEVSDSTALNARNVSTAAGRREWWGTRHELDARLKALLEGMEENWFGAFKVCLPEYIRCVRPMEKLITPVNTCEPDRCDGKQGRQAQCKAVKGVQRCLAGRRCRYAQVCQGSTGRRHLALLCYAVIGYGCCADRGSGVFHS